MLRGVSEHRPLLSLPLRVLNHLARQRDE